MAIGNLMIDIQGTELTNEDRDLLGRPNIGGVILFTRNYESIKQLKTLVQHTRAASSNQLLIAVDQEGGRVQRFRKGFSKLPALIEIGRLYKKDSKAALHLSYLLGWLMAAEIRSIGIDISFAPVLDLYYQASRVIATRAFHEDPEIVILLADAYITGMNEAGMGATGKHFPGHGHVMEDSHLDLPVDRRSREVITASDLKPFIALSQKLTGIMTAHVVYSSVDLLPASFSSIWLREILRKTLAFNGAIFSDDLSMFGASVAGDVYERVKKAYTAGCDMLVLCNSRDMLKQIVDKTPIISEVSQQRLLKFCGRFRYTYTDIQNHKNKTEAEKLLMKAGL